MAPHTKYNGRTFDVQKFNGQLLEAAAINGFDLKEITVHGQNYPVYALIREAVKQPATSVYISAGVHGDEPAGPLALLKMIDENLLPQDVNLTIIPLVNPVGMSLNQREDINGDDINRDFLTQKTETARALSGFLKDRTHRFDVCIDLHEDWEATGFYMYNKDMRGGKLDEQIISRIMTSVKGRFGVDTSPLIDGWNAVDGIIDFSDRTTFGEGMQTLVQHIANSDCSYGFVIETPSNTPMDDRMQQHITTVDSIFHTLREHGALLGSDTPCEDKLAMEGKIAGRAAASLGLDVSDGIQISFAERVMAETSRKSGHAL